MTSKGGVTKASRRSSIRELVQGRTQVLEKLAGVLEEFEAAKGAVAAAEQTAADKAGRAREVYQEAMDAGWTASELTSAGLKPPAPPRQRRGGGSDDGTAAPAE